MIIILPKKVLNLSAAKIMENWHYCFRQNENVDNIINEIEKNHLTNLKDIDEVVSNAIENNFLNNKEYLSELQSSLLIQAYSAYLADLKITSSILYSLCYKNPYLKLFITSIMDKSIYHYLVSRLYEYKAKNETKFKNITKTNFTKDEIINIMEQLENKWSPKKE